MFPGDLCVCTQQTLSAVVCTHFKNVVSIGPKDKWEAVTKDFNPLREGEKRGPLACPGTRNQVGHRGEVRTKKPSLASGSRESR